MPGSRRSLLNTILPGMLSFIIEAAIVVAMALFALAVAAVVLVVID